MRNHARAVLGLMLAATVFATSSADAQESRFRWWPFGGGQEEAPIITQTSATETIPSADEQRPWLFKSPFGYVGWPEIKWPSYELNLPRPSLPTWHGQEDVSEVRNAWLPKEVEPNGTSVFEVLTNGMRRVGESTRTAWRTTVDRLSPGGGDMNDLYVAQQDLQPPFWKGWFGGSSEQQHEGPRTVSEWMAQDRLDP